MEKIVEKIKKDRPNLSASSLKSYERNLRVLYQKMHDTRKVPENIKYLENFEKVKEFMNDWKLSTKKTYISSIVVALRAFDAKESLMQKYGEFLTKLGEQYDNKAKEQKKTEKEEKNWATINDLYKVLKIFQSKVRRHGIRKKNELDREDKKTLLSFLILSLYLVDVENHPPRRLEDYASMKIVNKSKKIPNDDDNFLMNYSRNKKEFVFQRYKTKSIYKTQTFKVSPKMNSVLNLWLKFNDSEDLIPMSANQLSKFLTSLFQKYLGKKISVNMIRHIYISDVYKDVPALKKLSDTAGKMGHNVQTAMKEYVKNDGSEGDEEDE